MKSAQNTVLSYLSESVREAAVSVSALHGILQEIRLYRNGYAAVVCQGKTCRTSALCPAKEFDSILWRLCGNSLYAHGDTIRRGYICTSEGIRVGVCGRAVTEDGEITLVTDITSLCLRIPTRIPDAAEPLMPHILRDGRVCGMLIWSPPGVGKTTALREIAASLARADPPVRVAVVDSRQEITASLDGDGLDILLGYPRSRGMEIAVRTMAPQAVLCDEIADEADADAVLACASSGTAVIATAHGGSYAELLRKEPIRRLIANGVFPSVAELMREDAAVRCRVRRGECP